MNYRSPWKILLPFCLLLPVLPLLGQVPSATGFAEAGASAASAANTPFWLRANQSGLVPLTGPFGTVRAGYAKSYRYPWQAGQRRHFDWRYGIEAAANAGASTRFLLPEAYVSVRRWGFELHAGRKREVIGLADSTLGMGPFAGANNALPIPKVQLSIPEFLPIGFLQKIIAIKGQYAHGWFSNAGPVKDYYLHQKSFYSRFGKPHWPVKLYGGFLHLVQWGGRSDQFAPTSNVIKQGKFPASWKDYLDMVSGSSLGYNPNVDTTIYSFGDRSNRIGNHLGTIDLGIEVTTSRFSVLAYRQSIFEDGSLFYLINIKDGLNGIRLRNRRQPGRKLHIHDVVTEYLYTKSQGGAVMGNLPKERGNDNYFNNSQYIDGWSYAGRGIGTPFITPYTETRSAIPKAQVTDMVSKYYYFFSNSRVEAVHIGISGSYLSDYQFVIKGSYSTNYGRYGYDLTPPVTQFSSLVQLQFPVSRHRQLTGTLSLGSDVGNLLPASTGFYASIRKTWTNRATELAASTTE